MYAKIHRSLWQGSMYGQGLDQLVFIFLCVHADANGVVDVIQAAIALAIGFPEADVRQALLRLEAEDPRSRTPTARGARIERLNAHRDWGWIILNYDIYRNMADIEKVREQTRLRTQRYREKLRSDTPSFNVTSRDVASRDVTVTHGDDKHKHRDKAEEQEGGMHTSVSLFDADVLPTSGQALALAETEEITSEQVFSDYFWTLYPRKVAKAAALQSWRRLKIPENETGEKIVDAILAGLRRDIAHEWKGRDPDKIPHASTWLNQRRWEG